MAFKLFESANIKDFPFASRYTILLSEDSTCADSAHFFTGVESLGKIKFNDINVPSSFGLTVQKEVKYNFDFDKTPLAQGSITAERPVGSFLTQSANQNYISSSNALAKQTHQAIFDYSEGYLYRPDNESNISITALRSSSTAKNTSVIRLITIRRDIMKSAIEPNSFKMEMNLSATSATGVGDSTTTSFTTAMSLKNPQAPNEANTVKSFFGVPWSEGTSLDTATGSLTIEAIIRPYNPESIILWRRLSSEGWKTTSVETQDAFMKLELTRSPDNSNNAFRFYVRSATADGEFSEDFATKSVQASGLFVPADAGVNLFDGKFHHLMVTWSISGLENAQTTEAGAGIVFGYVDGFKLLNREQVDPRLVGSDASNGPAVQANMYNQRIPIKITAIPYVDTQDPTPSGNNLYIGISNYNRSARDTEGDRGSLAASGDVYLAGGFDGEIQHIRMWGVRFDDGSTGLTDKIAEAVDSTSTAGISFADFHSFTGSSYSTNMIAWWNFNEINTLTASDASSYSNTGSLVGRSSINLYDHFDVTKSINIINDDAASSVVKTFLYVDSPEDNIINNDMAQGRIMRRAADSSLKRVGIIYYDLGVVVLDEDDENAKMNFVWPASGTTGDFGYSVTGHNNSALNVERLRFNSIENKGRVSSLAVAEGNEFNFTENPSGINEETGEPGLDDPTSYMTHIGLYNENGDMLAVAKLSKPIKKDEASKIEANVILDF